MNFQVSNVEPRRMAQRVFSALSVVAPPVGAVKAAAAGLDALLNVANHRLGAISVEERNARLRWDAKDALLGALQTVPGLNVVLGVGDLVSDTLTAPNFEDTFEAPAVNGGNPGPLSEELRARRDGSAPGRVDGDSRRAGRRGRPCR